MSYRKGDLMLSDGVPFLTRSLWFIGGPDDVRAMIRDLTDILEEMEQTVIRRECSICRSRHGREIEHASE